MKIIDYKKEWRVVVQNLVKKIAKKIIYSLPSSYTLMFHHLEKAPALPRSGCRLETESFYEIILRFPQESYASVKEILNKTKRKIALTFDDGLEDVYRIAYPFLKEKKIPFCIFVVTEFLDQPGYITTEQLLEMNADPLVTIGSHGITHEVLKGLPEAEQVKELQESKRILEELIGKTVDYFAYSHGQFDSTTLHHINIYKNAFAVTSRGLNMFTYRRWAEPRINIDSTVDLKAKIEEIERWVKK